MKIPEIKRMEDLLIEFLGEPKSRYGSDIEGQRIFNCPCCAEENGGVPDGKYNLEVSFEKDLNHGGVFNCWKCSSRDRGMKGNVFKLIRKYGTADIYKEFKECVKAILETRMYDIDAFTGATETVIEKEAVRLPKTFKKIDIATCRNPSLLNYLDKRKIDQEMIDRFNLGYTEWDGEDFAFRNRIIIPSYDQFGELNYFIGRDFTGKGKIKYRNCDADKKELVFQESLIDWDAPIYLCEGAFDAMRFPLNGISMLGKVLTKDTALYRALYAKANSTITIVLDGDTHEDETKRIYMLLNFGRLKGKIRYINMAEDCNYKDMSELYEHEGKKGVINLLRKQREYDEFDLIF